jgi:hypothetical protein
MFASDYKPGDFVFIRAYANDPNNMHGKVTFVNDENGLIHVSNLNMPFSGTVCKFFSPNDLEKYK